jgi:hypothetical protein
VKLLTALLAIVALAATGCSEAVPHDIANYKERCIRMNAEPIPEKDSDPHRGVKNVYACGVTEEQLVEDGEPIFPYPEGTIIVKESTREGQGYPWLIATARKEGGVFRWDEYTRNFPDQEFLHILAGEEVCTDCHKDVEKSSDWIFTVYRGASPVE